MKSELKLNVMTRIQSGSGLLAKSCLLMLTFVVTNLAHACITADVVALDQVFYYNRLGAMNPAGMIYALKRDVVAITGIQPSPGNAMLRPGKRPRPLVLGDFLKIIYPSGGPNQDVPFWQDWVTFQSGFNCQHRLLRQ